MSGQLLYLETRLKVQHPDIPRDIANQDVALVLVMVDAGDLVLRNGWKAPFNLSSQHVPSLDLLDCPGIHFEAAL